MTPKAEDVIVLSPDEFPRYWYNILPDLPESLPPPQNPPTGGDRIAELQQIMIPECLRMEFSDNRWIPIPDELREVYIRIGRPRPLMRCRRLERYLKTPAKLYVKREDMGSPTGSHKINTALAQAFFAAKAGFEGLVTETGAGQWGSALAYATALFDLRCVIFWVRFAYNWKPGRRIFMQLYRGEVHASPSPITEVGRKLLEKDPNHPGSLSIAISEGLEYARVHDEFRYALGSVLNHVLLHQTIIGLETLLQCEKAGIQPDIMISSLGGGSNFGGFVLPAIGEVLKGKRQCEFLAAQSLAAPNLVKGEYRYDYADAAGTTPLLKMYTLGHDTEMPVIRAEGLRYHAAAPIISYLRYKGIVRAVAYAIDEKEVFEAARILAQTEGITPAPESAYSAKAAIDEALRCRESGEEKVILFSISGHGFLDLDAYAEKLFKEELRR
ncbi:TrpB-like pyridoxal phosphate-dependent enzyme [archaeon]|nr:TrpB-like pyridoxal phosphate-dependent enzyme [archaeon]